MDFEYCWTKKIKKIMENFNKKELINELQRAKDLMYGKEIINEQVLTVALRNVLTSALRTILKNTIKKNLSDEVFSTQILGNYENIANTVRNAKGAPLTKAEETAIYQELQKVAKSKKVE